MKVRTVYLILVGAALVSMLTLHYVLDLLPFIEKAFCQLEDHHKEQLRMLIERSKLISGLASAVFAAAGGLLLKVGKKASSAVRIQAVWIFILAGSSLLFGYLSFSEVIWMLDSKFFNLDSGPVRIPFEAQFLLFLSSVIVLGHFFLTVSQQIEEKDKAKAVELNPSESAMPSQGSTADDLQVAQFSTVAESSEGEESTKD